jgi:hypothetical protein
MSEAVAHQPPSHRRVLAVHFALSGLYALSAALI